MYVSPRRRISMQIHRDGRFAVKFQGLPPSRNPTLYLYLHLPSLFSSFCFTITFSVGATSLSKLYELSVRSSQLLCWELTGQHPISNKACHRAVVSLRLIRASRRWTPTPSRIPCLIFPSKRISNFRRTLSYIRRRAGFFPSQNQSFLRHSLKEIRTKVRIFHWNWSYEICFFFILL